MSDRRTAPRLSFGGRCGPWCLLWTGAVLAAAPAAAQSVALDYYRHRGEPVPVRLHLDSLGVALRQGADPGRARSALAPLGLVWVREMPESLHLFALRAPVGRDSIVALARVVLRDHGALVVNAGPIARWTGHDTPWILTDQLLVRFRQGVSPAQVDSLNVTAQARTVWRSRITPSRYVVHISAASPGDALEVARFYQSNPIVESVYPDMLGGATPTGSPPPQDPHTGSAVEPRPGASARARHVPNDPLFPLQWHLDNATGVGHIGAASAWDTELGSPATVIAIIELTGFDTTHADLAGNLWVNPAEKADGVDNDGNGWIDDVNGCGFRVIDASSASVTFDPLCDMTLNTTAHGNAVAGLAAAVGDNMTGVSGVCPKCSLMLLAAGSSLDGKVEAFEYAVAHGARAINASWAMAASGTELETAIVAAANHGPGGIPIVFSMDNTNVERCAATPDLASLPEVFAVGASSDGDIRLPAAWGSCIDAVAPAGAGTSKWGITTTDALGSTGFNDGTSVWGSQSAKAADCAFAGAEPAVEYTRCFGGTSAAAPIVTGVMGLLLSHDPGLSRDDVYDIVRETAVKIDPSACAYVSGFSEKCGWGRVDAAAAIGLKSGPVVTPSAGARVEVGVRLGVTALLGTSDRTVAAIPGSGPRAVPVLHAGLVYPAWMAELQLGFRHESFSGTTPSTTEFVIAFQPAVFFGGLYVGPNGALRYVNAATSSTQGAIGLAVGYRWMPEPFLGLRVEARYRNWPGTDEVGLALGAGVVF